MTHPEDALYPYAVGGPAALDDASREAVAAHLQICGECRRAVEEIAAMHAVLSRMPPEAVSDDFVARAAAGATLRAGWTWRRLAAAAVVLFAVAASGVAGGWQWRASRIPPAATPRPAPVGERYMVVFYEPLARRVAEPVEVRRDRIRRFSEWQRPLAESRAILSGARLRDEGGRVFRTSADVDVLDAQVPPGLALTGFLIFTAASYEDAARFVIGCPLFEDGGRVELRRAF